MLTILPSIKLNFFIIALCIILNGCANFARVTPEFRQHTHYGQAKLYAELVKTDGQYFFKNITPTPAPVTAASVPVIFNDLTPAFDTSAIPCPRYLWVLGSDCESSNLFFSQRVRPLETSTYWLFSLGVTLLAGRVDTAAVFDAAAFDLAVTAAMENSAWQHKRRQIFLLYDALNKTATQYNSDLQILYEEQRQQYRKISKMPLVIQPEIQDRSGLYQAPITLFQQYVGIYPVKLTSPQEDFLTYLNKLFLETPLTPAIVEQNFAHYYKSLTSYKNERYAYYQARWQEDLKTFQVKCQHQNTLPRPYLTYHFALDCPAFFKLSDSIPTKVMVTINSLDIHGLYPVVETKNTELAVRLHETDLTLTNLSSQQLKPRTFRLQYNGKSNQVSFDNLVIAPYSSQTVDIAILFNKAIATAAYYPNINIKKAKALNTSIQIKVDYVTHSEKSLDYQQTSTLYKLLQAQDLI